MNREQLPQSHDPLSRGGYLHCQHLERYRFAAGLVSEGQRALDVACGTGYGSAMLRAVGARPVGVDLEVEQLGCNRERWGGEFVAADALRLPFRRDSFDAVVTFETIEHVRDGAAFLEEMARVLKPGGLFIGSTPNIRYTAHPPYHVREYEPGEFFALVAERFAEVQQLGQYFSARDRVGDLVRRTARAMVRRVLERTGTLDAVRARRPGRPTGRPVDAGRLLDPVTACRDYVVSSLRGIRLLRVMVVVARKTS